MAERQRVPDLDQMDERAAHEFLTELYSLLSTEAEDRIRHDEYTMEWPQAGERLRGRDTMRAFTESNAGSRPPRWPRRTAHETARRNYDQRAPLRRGRRWAREPFLRPAGCGAP